MKKIIFLMSFFSVFSFLVFAQGEEPAQEIAATQTVQEVTNLPEECTTFFGKYDQCKPALPAEIRNTLDQQVENVKKSLEKLAQEGNPGFAKEHCQKTNQGFAPIMQKYGCSW